MSQGHDATTSPTDLLAHFVSRLELSRVPHQVQDRVKRILLDSFICALVADHSDETRSFDAAAFSFGTGGDSTVLGAEQKRPLAAATLLNGFRITAMTACDVYRPAHCHMTPEIIPPAIAIAENRQSTGADLLRALIAGFETAVRVAQGVVTDEFRRRRWHAPGVVGPFGGAAAAACIMGLDHLGTRHALAIAGSQASGTYVAHGTPTVKFHQAGGALAGLLGAVLAESGLVGSREILASSDGGILSTYSGGGSPDEMIDGLGDHWKLEEISLRLWPGGSNVQPALAAVDALTEVNDISSDDVELVSIGVSPSVRRSQSKYSNPRGTFECLASIEFAVATKLRWGRVSVESFVAPSNDDPALRELIENRIDVYGDDSLEPEGCRIQAKLRDGSTVVTEVDRPRGLPENPLTWDDLAMKAHDFADRILGSSQVDEMVSRVRQIETESSVADLLSIVRLGK